VPCEDIARRDAERHEIPRPVEAVDEVVEAPAVPFRIEVAHELPGRPHGREHPLELRAEEVDATVGQTRGEQRHDLAIARLGVAQREPDRVALDAGGVVKLAVEPLERLAQRRGGRHRPRGGRSATARRTASLFHSTGL
jgi:hypothetical protein